VRRPCRCQREPFKRLTKADTKRLPGALNGLDAGKHARVEAKNRRPPEGRARAGGYRRFIIPNTTVPMYPII